MKTKHTQVYTQGLITLWNVDEGLPQIDKYLFTSETHMLGGALLGVGVMHCSRRHEYDPVSGILTISIKTLQCGNLLRF